MSDDPKDKIEDLGSDFEVIEDLGDDFEVIEEPPAAASPAATAPPPAAAASTPEEKSAPAATASPAAAGGAGPIPPGGVGPVRSTNAWRSFGLGVAVAGLLSGWNVVGGDLVGGLLLAWAIWELTMHGLAAAWRPIPEKKPILPAILLVYAGARLALASGGMDALGWAAGSLLDASGAMVTALGAVLALASPSLGKKVDANLQQPAGPEGATPDRQFSLSLLAYLMVLTGMLMPWADSGQRGVDSLFGAITALCVVLVVWASWVGAWKMWSSGIVTKKLGAFLFLAPMEAFILGLMGTLRHAVEAGEGGIAGVLHNAWPGVDNGTGGFLAWAGGPLLTLIGSGLAFYVLITGAKQAVEMTKQRKAAEVEARKSARATRQGGDGAAKKGADKPARGKSDKKGADAKKGGRKGRK